MKNARFILPFIAALSLSACSTSYDAAEMGINYNLPKAEVVLKEDNYVMNYPEKGNKAFLKDEVRFKRQIEDIRSDQVESITLYQPKGDISRSLYVQNILKTSKLGGKKITITVDDTLVNQTVLNVVQWKAEVDNCPDWSKKPGTDYYNSNGANFGCATEQNLASMIADPHDLERGRDAGPADAHQGVGAVDRYRRNEITELRREDGVLNDE